MLVERRALAQERRIVPETIARFMGEASPFIPFALYRLPAVAHALEPGNTGHS